MSVLTPQQEQFSSTLSNLTGLDRNVIRGWALAEESGSAAQKRVAQKNFNFLNIGYFDSGAAGWAKGGGPFSNPVTAAKATAQFLKGQRWGASKGIQGILSTAGQSPAAQIKAIAGSGWASSGYGGGTNLAKTFSLVSGVGVPSLGTGNAIPPGGAKTLTPAMKPIVAQDTGPEAALKILNAKSAPEALTLYKNSQIKIVVDPGVAPETGGTGLSPNVPGVVALAKQYLGTPYVWGGTTPKGFDCSGLLQYVWAKKGVKIPRTTYQQIKAGKQVPLTGLQAGDAVFFGSSKDPHHVGMYIGNGQFIQAPHTGDVVKISNLSDYMSSFVQARRFT